ncbi:MAG: hypothetical protein WCC28_18595 [Mycobacterium sp.]|uniref:hypothetical protein n=1 Tax=Mycobacterium sp. TaxID=1785 RepID=UPI003C765A48
MPRHRLARGGRKSPVLMAAVAAPVAIIFALGGSAHAQGHQGKADAVADAPCCQLQIMATAPTTAAWAASTVPAIGAPDETAPASRASRWHVASTNAPQVLISDVAPERGLQVKTILAARTISAVFPEIKNMGGVRPDALRWHPEGLAIDVIIPNPSSAAGIALGNQIVSFALKNADKFSLQDCIWRGTYYTPKGPSGSGYGHYDHVHITTRGGGYPKGGEVYLR